VAPHPAAIRLADIRIESEFTSTSTSNTAAGRIMSLVSGVLIIHIRQLLGCDRASAVFRADARQVHMRAIARPAVDL
jgi:hypothetical protein